MPERRCGPQRPFSPAVRAVDLTLERVANFEERLMKADRLHAITQRVGYALWQLQQLEGSTAQYFVLVVEARPGMGLAAGEVLTEKALSRTFGATITQLTKAKQLPQAVETQFKALLAERNWLVHRFPIFQSEGGARRRRMYTADRTARSNCRRSACLAQGHWCSGRSLCKEARGAHARDRSACCRDLEAVAWRGSRLMVAVRSNRLVGADTQRITSDVERPFSAPATIGHGHRTAAAPPEISNSLST